MCINVVLLLILKMLKNYQSTKKLSTQIVSAVRDFFFFFLFRGNTKQTGHTSFPTSHNFILGFILYSECLWEKGNLVTEWDEQTALDQI